MNVQRLIRILIPIAVLAGIAWFATCRESGYGVKVIPYTDFMQAVSDGSVDYGSFQKDVFIGHMRSGDAFKVILPADNGYQRIEVERELREAHVRFEFQKPVISDTVSAMLISVLLPIGIVFLFWMFVMSQARKNQAIVGEAIAVTIPPGLKEFVAERVTAGGYETPAEYLRELVRADQKSSMPGDQPKE